MLVRSLDGGHWFSHLNPADRMAGSRSWRKGLAMVLVHLEQEPCTTRSLPHSPESVRTARKQMVAELLAYGLSPDLVSDAEMVLGELAANAVEHGEPIDGADFEVSWCVVNGSVRVSVIDGGCVPSLRSAAFDSTSLRGRGLRIVDTVCDNWVADFTGGTRVTADLRISG